MRSSVDHTTSISSFGFTEGGTVLDALGYRLPGPPAEGQGPPSLRALNAMSVASSGPAGPGPGSGSLAQEPPSSLFFHYPLCRGNIPPARWAHAAAVVGGVVWAYGGVGNAVLDDLCALDADTLSWRVVTTHAARSKDRPEKMLGHAAAATGNRIWIFGGQQGRKYLRTLFSFDTDTCMWTRHDSDEHPSARAGHAMVAVHGSVYMFGGQGKRLYNDLHKLDPATGTFTEVAAAGKAPSPRRGHSFVWDGRDCLVCFGGMNATSTDAQLSVFSLSRSEWLSPQAFGPAPSARTQHSAVLLSPGIVLVFGGCSSAGTFFNDLAILDTRTFTWSKPSLLNTAPAPRYHHTCSLVNGRILVYGGINSKQTFDGVVVVETKFINDLASVAEELFRMSAASTLQVSALSAAAAATATASPNTTIHLAAAGSITAASVRSPRAQLPGTQAAPALVLPDPPAGATGAAGGLPQGLLDPHSTFGNPKALEAVKGQLADLLLRRNLEEQHVVASKKAETTESLLAKEREAREGAMKEVLQYKLLLAEAEAAAASAQQQLQAALSRANREAAAAAEARAQLEAAQAKLGAREEELQEARLLQDGLVRELGTMASRYSRLAMDAQEDHHHGVRRSASSGAPGAARRGGSGRSSSAAAAAGARDSVPSSSSGGGVDMDRSSASVSGSSSPSSSEAGSGAAAGDAGGNGRGGARPADAAGALRGGPGGCALRAAGPSGASPFDAASGAATVGPALGAAASGAAEGPARAGNATCQQLLLMLSESEVHRAAMLKTTQEAKDAVQALSAENAALQAQLQRLHGEALALECLSLCELEALENKLNTSTRAVRDVMVLRKIDEAQRRSSTEQALCALCMEGPKAVVFNCGHQSCEPCSVKISSCPFCRVSISARIRLFDA